MTLNQFACRAIRDYAMARGGFLSCELAERDPLVAAWLVWSMRGTEQAREFSEQYNRARRALQRAGIRRV